MTSMYDPEVIDWQAPLMKKNTLLHQPVVIIFQPRVRCDIWLLLTGAWRRRSVLR